MNSKVSSPKANLLILSLVMVVNALSYGTIIPLMYPYAARFGITPQSLGLLFASFSIAQFFATPIIGRLSDKYGRKPLLLISLLGTSVSLALFGLASSAFMLFVARILDGITGGNVSVAQAAIADVTSEKDRAQAFGLLGAAFGIGFVLGPAIGGLLSQVSISAPFLFASGLALFGVVLGTLVFKETNLTREDHPHSGKLIDIPLMFKSLTLPAVGPVFLTSLLALVATNAMIMGFQTFTVDVLKLDTFQIGILFALFGVISIIMQGFGIRYLLKKIPNKIKLIQAALVSSAIFLGLVTLSHTTIMFAILILTFGIFNSPIGPTLTALLSERSNQEDQGGILGLNQGYTSVAQIIGPLVASAIIGINVSYVFIASAGILLIALFPSKKMEYYQQKVDL